MQITIDLGNFWDQDPQVIGSEVLSRVADQVREQSLSPETYSEAKRLVDIALTKEVREGVHAAIMEIVALALDDEFTIVTGYGEVGKKTSLRQQIKEQMGSALASITGGNRNSYPNDFQRRWTDLINNTLTQVVTDEVKPFVGELRAKYENGFQEALDNALLSIKTPRR